MPGDPDDHEEQIESDDPTVVMRQIDENPAAHFELPSGSEEQEVQVDSTQVTGENATTTTHILLDDESVINPSGVGSDDDHEEHVESDDPDTSNETQIDETPHADFKSTSGS
uniref:Uncharacterized protein n=1 Tax=Solanum tuberosum TaxID=4113 RepID=M1DNR9_SOLTU